MSNVAVESREPFFLVRRMDTFGGFDDCGDEEGLMDINAAAGWKNNFQEGQLLRNNSGSIDCHITQLTGVKTILRLRTRGTTYLCLKDMAYTD